MRMSIKRLITTVSAAAALVPDDTAYGYPQLDEKASKLHSQTAAKCKYDNGPLIATPRRSRKRLEIDVDATSLHTIEVHCPAAENRSAFDVFYGDNPVLTWYSRGSSGNVSERNNYLFAKKVTPNDTGFDPLRILSLSGDRSAGQGGRLGALMKGESAVEVHQRLWRRIGNFPGIKDVCSAVINIVGQLGTFDELCGIFYDIAQQTVSTAEWRGWDSKDDGWGLSITEVTPPKK